MNNRRRSSWVFMAVALLTAWAEGTDGDRSLTQQLLTSYWLDAAAGGDVRELLTESIDLSLGLLSLSGSLLMELGRATGCSPEELLDMIGRRIAQGR